MLPRGIGFRLQHFWISQLEGNCWNLGKVKVRDASGVLLCTGQFPGTKNDLATVLLLKKPAREKNTAQMRLAGKNGETEEQADIFCLWTRDPGSSE